MPCPASSTPAPWRAVSAVGWGDARDRNHGDWHGALADAEETAGDVTIDGTVALIIFGGILFGASVALCTL